MTARGPVRAARALWLPVLALCGVAGALGVTLGLRAAAVGETPVIEAMAARYLTQAGAGARATDCHARPAPGGMPGWLVVTCGRGGNLHEYHVNRLGWLTRETRRPLATMPET